ncbi:MAG: methyltransferase domain-containing protein [Clostridiales bacterium]|nr:methyltransferase domain-containing protein [Clostridiales bacterium]
MKYTKATRFTQSFIDENIMGPNPAKLLEQLLAAYPLEAGMRVLDLGCGRGVTSIMLAKEYGLTVFATDLWIGATENWNRFRQAGFGDGRIVPIHAEAHDLPYAEEFFDAVVCIDSYHYYGLDREYLGKHLLPLVKPGGWLLIVVPGFRRDIHDALPEEMLISWRAEDLDTFHDMAYWKEILSATSGLEIVSVYEMEDLDECWQDWLNTENPYAINDRASMEAGSGKYMNFIAMALKRK